jgi:hypothetical protein
MPPVNTDPPPLNADVVELGSYGTAVAIPADIAPDPLNLGN